jgi:hypothetical protein
MLEIVRATFLTLVSVTAWALLVVPTICPANARLAGDMVREGFATAVADSATTVGELLALLTIEMLPVTLPAFPGAKLVLRVARPPLGTVRGSERPLMLNPGPVTVAWDTQMGDEPELSRVMVFVLMSPTITLPKLALTGLTLSEVDPAAFATRLQTVIRSKAGKKSLARRPVWCLTWLFLTYRIRALNSAEKGVISFWS